MPSKGAQVKKVEEFNPRYLEFAKRVTKQLIARYGVSAGHYDDYLSAAYLGLVEAASRFDKSAGIPFERFAYRRVRGAIIDHIRESAGLSSKEYKACRLLEASDCLTDDFQQIRLRLDPGNIDQALAQVLNYAAKGALLFRLNHTECEEEILEKSEEQRSPEREVLSREASRVIRRAIQELPPREQIIIRAFYFEEKCFQEIADQDLHVTRSWVSRMHSKALGLLKERLTELFREMEEIDEK